MNQILVTKKLYITPELKRKKKLYQVNFIFSIFLVVSLISIYIYAEYDRNKSEEVSQEILADMNISADNTIAPEDEVLVVLLENTEVSNISDEDEEEDEDEDEQEQERNSNITLNEDDGNTDSNSNSNSQISSVNGYKYKTIGTINIPKINITYPIIDGKTDSVQETDELLKVAPTKFWGPDLNENWGEAPNKQGNLVIVAHNYRNSMFFSKVPTLSVGDIIELTDTNGSLVKYSIYKKDQVDPSDVAATSQHTNGRREITLITCTDNNVERVVVKARAI